MLPAKLGELPTATTVELYPGRLQHRMEPDRPRSAAARGRSGRRPTPGPERPPDRSKPVWTVGKPLSDSE